MIKFYNIKMSNKQPASKKHSSLLSQGGLGNDAINYINNSIQKKKQDRELEKKIMESFYLTPQVESYDEDEYQKHISEIRQQDKQQFRTNHAEQLSTWNKGTLDINKYREKIKDIEDAQSQMDLSKHLISKKAEQMTYKIDEGAQKYNQKLDAMKKMQEKQDKIMFEDTPVKVENNIEKWKGTGLEDEIKKYENPVEKRKKPLFEKSVYGLDGAKINDYQMKNAIDHSYKTLSQKLKESENIKQIREYTKDKIHSQSKFFILKGAEKLPSHYKERQPDITAESKVKVYSNLYDYEYEMQELIPKKKSKLSEFGRKSEEAKIPLVKNWFESLELEERALCVSTIDIMLVENMREMYKKLKKVPNNDSGKFRMIYQQPSFSMQVIDKFNNTPKKEEKKREQRYLFNICNAKAHQSTAEIKAAEAELLDYIRLTDTFEMHDTITVCSDLLENPKKFYELAEQIVGQLFLKTPHEIKYLDGDATFLPHCFECKQPPWLVMSEPNSLVTWILYYIERAIFIQFQNNVYGDFVSIKDSNKQPLFVGTDGKYISLQYELRPFWRSFCEEKEGVDELLLSLREKYNVQLGLNKEINSFNGGLTMQEPGQRDIISRVEMFIEKWESMDLKTVCHNTLGESVHCHLDKTPLEIVETYKFELQTQKAPMTKSVTGQSQNNLMTKIDCILERIFIDHFREHINSKLKSRFTSQNKKLQKKKLKKLKQKEQMQEKERLEKQAQEQKEVIKINNSLAIDMLLGKTIEDDQPAEKTTDFTDVKKKNKKKKKQSTTPKEEVTPPVFKQEVTPPVQIDPQNYFQVFAQKYEESQVKDNSSKTNSTCEETKKMKVPTEINQAMSNEEILMLTDYKTGNAQISSRQWQRASRPFVSDLISESSTKSISKVKTQVIDIIVKNNKLYSQLDVGVEPCSSSSSSKGPHKSIITFKKKQNPKIIPKKPESSSSHTSSDNDEDMLPDLFNQLLQPEENDSSDYGATEEEQGSSEESSSSAQLSTKKKKSHKSAVPTQQQSRQIVLKPKKRGKKNKTPKKSEPFIIDFYGNEETKIEPKILFQEEKIINRWTKIKDIPTFTVQYIEKFAQHTFEHVIPDAKKNKKNKKQKKIDWEAKYADIDPQIPQIEIIKPVIDVKKEQAPVIQISKKQKKKVDAQASADAMNSFIKKIAGQTREKQQQKEVKEPEVILEKEEVKTLKSAQKTHEEPVTSELTPTPPPKQKQKHHPEPVPVKETPPKKAPKQKMPNQQGRLSNIEEAKILSTGFRYEAKKKDTTESPKKLEQPEIIHKHSSMVDPSQPIGLSLESKAFTSENPEKPEKKKAKKVRSNKNKKKKQLQANSWIDPQTGIEVYEDYQEDVPQFSFNQQVQDLLSKLNDQMLVQQQKQIQELQQRQQQEADMMVLEECQPCQELDTDRYDLFFDELEQEMKSKVKEIDLLKDSVRKERQGFISIVESIVKNTFTNRYGNGFVGIKIFGSMATELAIESSDVDLVVTGINSIQGRDPQYGGGKNQLLKMMQKLFDNLQFLKEKGQIYKIKFIHGANVPIIKLVVDLQAINQGQIQKAIAEVKREREAEKANEGFQFSSQRYEDEEIDLKLLGIENKTIDEKMRYLKVDISIDEQNQQFQNLSAPKGHSGIDTIYHIQELVLYRKDLRPIVMIIKKIFDETFLSMPYFGGISSYSLVLMVSAYLKRFDADKQVSLSRNLSGFFHFYGVGFKPHLFYLNGDTIEFCEDSSQRPFQDPFIVLDPLDTSNNISHSTFRIKDIQRALVQAFKIINESCERFQQDEKEEEAKPKAVLDRLMTTIQQQYQVQYNIYDDDF